VIKVSEEEKKTSKKTDEIPVEDIKEILQVVNDQLPSLIRGLFSSLYSAETAEQYANGIATIYKTLNDQGLPPEMVEKLVLKYSDQINVVSSALRNIDVKTRKDDDED
jgi:hypothetical protein